MLTISSTVMVSLRLAENCLKGAVVVAVEAEDILRDATQFSRPDIAALILVRTLEFSPATDILHTIAVEKKAPGLALWTLAYPYIEMIVLKVGPNAVSEP